MDPLRCLLEANGSMSLGDIDSTLDCLDTYDEWRSLGGFNPEVPAQYTYGLGILTGDQFYEFIKGRMDHATNNR